MGLHGAFHLRILGVLHLVGWGGEGRFWGRSCDRRAWALSFVLHTHFRKPQIAALPLEKRGVQRRCRLGQRLPLEGLLFISLKSQRHAPRRRRGGALWAVRPVLSLLRFPQPWRGGGWGGSRWQARWQQQLSHRLVGAGWFQCPQKT